MRQLLDEIRMLTAAFPDLHDSFDDDELPIMFRIRRDAAAAQPLKRERRQAAKRPNRTKLAKPRRGRVKT